MLKTLPSGIGSQQNSISWREALGTSEEAIQAEQDPFYLVENAKLKIKTKAGELIPFVLNAIQKKVLAKIKELVAQGKPIRIWILKARQEGVCLDPDTKVLTSDLRWVYIDDIPVGQKIMAVDESAIYQIGRKLKVGVVIARRDVYEKALKVTMEDGRELIATPEHRFLCRRRSSTETQWRSVKDMRIGDVIRHITNVWGSSDFNDGWFGGIIDGEGTVRKKTRAGCEMTVSQRPGAVYNRARKYLKDNGYIFREEMDNRLYVPNGGKFSDNPVGRLVLGRMDELFRLIGKTRPERFVNKEWWEGKSLPGRGNGCEAWCKIVNIELLERQRMIDLQTSTKTFIAEGFVSHNSTLIEALIYAFTSQRQNVNSLIIADDIDGANYLFGMSKLFHDELDPDLRHPLKLSNQKKLEFADRYSQILIDTADNTEAGRKYTFQFVHLSEVHYYRNAKILMLGLNQAVPELPMTMIIGETTGNGVGGYFFDQWGKAKKGETDWVPIFLAWFEHDEYRINLTKEEQEAWEVYRNAKAN